jgi:hypothetical protein
MRYRLLEALLREQITFLRPVADHLSKPMNERVHNNHTGNSIGYARGDDAWWDADRDQLLIKVPDGTWRIPSSMVKAFKVGTETEPSQGPVTATATAKAAAKR